MVQSRILVVDDDDGFRYSLEKCLRAAGFDVAGARDYRDALPLLDKGDRVDLLVTDIVMPHKVNGFALARMGRMRNHDLKVLYITAFEVPTQEAIGKILRKPVTGEQIVQEVQTALAA
jgi:CheY-like chemotaxis protein